MSYGDKTRAMMPLLNGKLTANQVAARVGCDAKTVRAVAAKHKRPLKAADRTELHAYMREMNERRHAEAEVAANYVWAALRQQVDATGQVSLVRIAEELRVGIDVVDGLVLRLRNHGRLKRKKSGNNTIWTLILGDEVVCRSTMVRARRHTMPKAFHAVPLAGAMPSDVEDAKLYLRRRDDVVVTTKGQHRVNGLLPMTDVELVEFAAQAKERDAAVRRHRQRAA